MAEHLGVGHEEEMKPNWQIQECYFGNACYPSWVIYRTDGERVQVRIDRSVTTQASSEPYDIGPNEVKKFLEEFQDCYFEVHLGRQTHDGQSTPPTLYVIGWAELVTQEQMDIYKKDLEDGWKK